MRLFSIGIAATILLSSMAKAGESVRILIGAKSYRKLSRATTVVISESLAVGSSQAKVKVDEDQSAAQVELDLPADVSIEPLIASLRTKLGPAVTIERVTADAMSHGTQDGFVDPK